MPKLTELDARFLKHLEDGSSQTVEDIKEADGIIFLCPKCYQQSGHSIICWFVHRVADDVAPKPGRWTPQGTGLNDLSFIPAEGRPNSVLLLGGCDWHGYVTNGEAA